MTPVDFWCDLSQQGTELLHCWEHTVGSCHAPIALRADWQQQLRRCHSELGFRYVRFHGLLSDDVGTVVTHNDELLYSFFNADQIVDFLLSIGMRPFVELSFMPTALASGSTTVFQYRGNVTRPKDYKQWSTLIHTLVSHWVDAVRHPGSGGVVLRSVERTESEGFLDWHPGGLLHAVSGHGERHQDGRPIAESRRTGDGARWMD